MSTPSNEPGSPDLTLPVAPDFALRALESAMDLGDRETVGNQIGRYTLLQKIGEGGFGAVWMAEQAEPLRRRVALKIIKVGMDTEEVIARFEAERQALALMDHPNIARVYDAGSTAAGRPYFVMELVRGMSITRYSDENRLTAEARLNLFVTVCRAVQHAHQKGVIHRDLKPSNILVTLHDGVPVPKVIDFGIAKATGRQLTEKTLVTQFHAFVGTPVYTSPEQMEMSGLDVDTRSDIYSLGVLLYQLLAGRLPFDPDLLIASGLEAMRRVIREVDPPRPSNRLSTLSVADRTSVASQRGTDATKLALLLRGDLDWIVMRCLEKDRTRRYETASGLADDIVRHLHDEPVVARPPGRWYRLQKLVRRNQTGFVFTGVVASALILGAALAAWQAVRATQAEREQSRLRAAAEQAAVLETRSRQIAEQQTTRAKETAERLRLQAYVSDIWAAQSALEIVRVLQTSEGADETVTTPTGAPRPSVGGNFNLGRCRVLLERHVPAAGETDLRGFEWRYLWALSRSHATAEFRQRYFQVTQAGMLPDEGTLVVGCGDSSIAIWDTVNRRVIRTFQAASSEFWMDPKVALSPDGAWLAICHANEVAVYDTATWQIIQRHPTEARQAVFIPRSTELVLLSKSALIFWDLTTNQTASSDVDARFYWAKLAAAPDGRRVYVSTQRQVIEVWDVASHELEQRLQGAYHVSLAISPDGRWLAAGQFNGSVLLWSVPDWKLHATTPAHDKWVLGLTFTADSRHLASGGSDQLIRLWRVPDSATAAELVLADTLQGHRGGVFHLALSAAGRQLVSAGGDWTVRLWPVSPDGRRPVEFHPRSSANIRGSLYLSARHGLVWAAAGSSWVGWNFRSGKETHSAHFVPAAKPRWMEWVEHWGGHMVYSTDQGVFRWDPLDGRTELLVSLTGSAGLAGIIQHEGRDFLLLELNSPPRIEAWTPGATAPSREPWIKALALLRQSVSAISEPARGHSRYLVSQSPDGRLLACMPRVDLLGQTEYPVTLAALDGTAVERKLTGHLNNIYSYAFSPDSRLLATGSLDTTTRIWDLAAGDECRHVLHDPSGPIYLQDFTADGRTLITCSNGWVIRFWNVRTGEKMLVLSGKDVGTGDHPIFKRWVVPPETSDGLLTLNPGRGGTIRFTPVPTLAAIDQEIRQESASAQR